MAGFRLVLMAALVYAITYGVFWPRLHTTLDESTYLNVGYALRQGTVYPDVVGLTPVGTYEVGAHRVSMYPLGMSALLAASSLFGWTAALGTNLIVQLATVGVLAWLLHRQGLPPAFAALLLLHPTAVLYSRTVMADPVSGLVLLLAFGALLTGRPLLSGVFLGAAVLFRTANLIALPLLVLGNLLERHWDSRPSDGTRESIRLALGAIPGVALAYYYAAVIAAGRSADLLSGFSLDSFPENLVVSTLSLSVVFPGMLLAPLVMRSRGRWGILLVSAGYLLFYSFWYWRDRGSSTVETLIAGQRYFLAILPLLIYAYAAVVGPILQTWPPRVLRVLGVAVGILSLVGIVGIHVRHARYVTPLLTVRSALLAATGPDDVLLTGTLVAKLFHPAWGTRALCLTGGFPEDIPRLRQCVTAALARPSTRVFAVHWTRPNREDDQKDDAVVSAVVASFPSRPATPQGVALPPDLRMIEVLR